MRKKKYRVQVKLNPRELRVLLEGMMWFRKPVDPGRRTDRRYR